MRLQQNEMYTFMRFSLVRAEGVNFNNSRACQFEWLKTQGFDIVEYRMVDSKNLEETIQYFSDKISTNDFPSDGLVALYDDIAYGDSLGRTAKFPRNAIAFNGRMRSGRLHYLILNGVLQEPV